MITPFEQIASARPIRSSITPDGRRIDTLQVRMWRPMLAEFNTHRVFTRNAGSSRAIPVMTVLGRDEAYVPRFRENRPGMSPGMVLTPDKQTEAERIWCEAMEHCRQAAEALASKDGPNVHKQWANRMTEWFSFVNVLVTSTQWSNFLALRDHEAAQDEIRILALAVKKALKEVTPKLLEPGEWHLPYVLWSDHARVQHLLKGGHVSDAAQAVIYEMNKHPDLRGVSDVDRVLLAISAARSCRLSYDHVDGTPSDLDSEMVRYLKLAQDRPLHASPMEHQARELSLFDGNDRSEWQGNLFGFVQFRKLLVDECL